MKKGNGKQKLHISFVALWTGMAYFFVALCIFYAAYQIRSYERGILEIYAEQQDAYVQLVLDQINLNKVQGSEKVIMDIIDTLDSSSNKYWTLSQEQTLVFVKDVTETNKYKGFTTDTYYISQSAMEFIDSLTVNRVTHSMIEMGDRKYITSGVVFEFGGSEYQICLLTNPDAVLEQNVYLSARVNLSLMIGVVLSGFLLIILTMARMVTKTQKELREEQETNRKLFLLIEEFNEQYALGDAYDVRKSLFCMDYFGLFYEKIRERDIRPVTFLLVKYKSEEAKAFFLQDSVLLLEKRIMRFKDDANGALLLAAVGMNAKQATEHLDWILCRELTLSACEEIKNPADFKADDILEKVGVKGSTVPVPDVPTAPGKTE